MVALIILLNILLCKFVEAVVVIDTNVMDLIAVVMITITVRPIKTLTQVCREIDIPINESSFVDVFKILGL